jgi:hypothetical protein
MVELSLPESRETFAVPFPRAGRILSLQTGGKAPSTVGDGVKGHSNRDNS